MLLVSPSTCTPLYLYPFTPRILAPCVPVLVPLQATKREEKEGYEKDGYEDEYNDERDERLALPEGGVIDAEVFEQLPPREK